MTIEEALKSINLYAEVSAQNKNKYPSSTYMSGYCLGQYDGAKYAARVLEEALQDASEELALEERVSKLEAALNSPDHEYIKGFKDATHMLKAEVLRRPPQTEPKPDQCIRCGRLNNPSHSQTRWANKTIHHYTCGNPACNNRWTYGRPE